MSEQDNPKKTPPSATIEEEIQQSYLDYAMSVIVGRALPDVRDGLKPVHRRIIYAMEQLGNNWNRSYKKSARIVGDVVGKYHPHGDTAAYDALVRMAQHFSMRYPLVQGQGNFGSVDGDSPAAMRYTEVRLEKITEYLIESLEKDSVDFVPNYDGQEMMPSVLPARFPNLLVNGTSGIAVGMATNIPPHNLGEILDACLALLEDSSLTVDDLIAYVPGPDFPTAGIIRGNEGIIQAYRTGKGRVMMASRHHFEEISKDKFAIVLTELPYQTNKARLIERIAELVKNKKIQGITAIRDESDKDGIRVVIELARGEVPEVGYNNLAVHSRVEDSFSINMVALVNGQPKQVNLKDVLEAFLNHRREVVCRRSLFELAKTEKQMHLLEGLSIAVANIDPVITIIKAAQDSAEAKAKLLAQHWPAHQIAPVIERIHQNKVFTEDLAIRNGLSEAGYQLTEKQAQAILDLRLHRLTGMEQEKLLRDYQACIDEAIRLIEILSNKERLKTLIAEELTEIKTNFSDKRRTEITEAAMHLDAKDLIAEEVVGVLISREGYIKTQSLDEFRLQRRGGRGKSSINLREEDLIDQMITTSNHDTLLCFTAKGRVYWLPVLNIPASTRVGRGRSINNLLQLQDDRVTSILPLSQESRPAEGFIMMVTQTGRVKKLAIDTFDRSRKSGVIAISLKDKDQLVTVSYIKPSSDIMLFSSVGKVIRFGEEEVRQMGRSAAGVIGMRLSTQDQKVVSMLTAEEGTQSFVLVMASDGYAKSTVLKHFSKIRRGGKGVIAMQLKAKALLVAAKKITGEEEVLLITYKGIVIRLDVSTIRVIGRNTKGVRAINLDKNDSLKAVSLLLTLDGADGAEGDSDGATEA